MFDSPGLVDFAIGLVNSVLNLPDGQMNFLGGNSHYRRSIINPAHPNFFFGAIKMTLGLVHVSCSLPEWQAVKLTFSAPWLRILLTKSLFRWGKPSQLAGLAHFTWLGSAQLMPCFLLKLLLCLYEKARWPVCRGLGSSNWDLGKQSSLPSHINSPTILRGNKASRASPANWDGSPH